MEPRGALHSIWSRRESLVNDASGEGQHEPHSASSSSSSSMSESLLLKFHKEPAVPVHPALEYEVVAEILLQEVLEKENNQNEETRLTRKKRRLNGEFDQEDKQKNRQAKLLFSFFFLIVSGVGAVVSAKLQAIPMRNYPNFLNLFGQMLYIPLCFAYLVPASHSTSRRMSNNDNNQRFSLSQWWPRRKLMKRFAIMGALDCLATTVQTFAAVYLPGPLLILLPQAAIPVSLALMAAFASSQNNNSNNNSATTSLALSQYIGAATVLLGIGMALYPVLLAQRAPDYYCEAQDPLQDCTTCRTATSEDDCVEILSKVEPESNSSNSVVNVSPERWLLPLPACRWLPFEESSKEKEFLEFVWSLALVASTVPMALSAIYKQRAMMSVEERAAEQAAGAALGDDEAPPPSPPPPALYVSGWIAVFQFVCSVAVTVPAGLVSSPLVRPLQIPANIFDGMFCYSGVGVVETGCHPDTACSDAALWVNITVVCHVVYTLSMMFVLKYSDGPDLLFMGLTAIVPLGHLCFTLPFMPERTSIHKSDLAGLIVILAGLVMYRFAAVIVEDPVVDGSSSTRNNPRNRPSSPIKRKAAARQEQEHRRSQSIGMADLLAGATTIAAAQPALPENNDEDDSFLHQRHTSLYLGSLWPVQNQTSYTLLRRDSPSARTTRSEDV